MHTSANDTPPDFTLLRVESPELEIAVIGPRDLPDDWQLRFEATRDLGTQWLRKNEEVLLQIPSAIVPRTANFLFNPLHPNARNFRVAEALTYPFDTRIKL